jgi:hypothetical protein
VVVVVTDVFFFFRRHFSLLLFLSLALSLSSCALFSPTNARESERKAFLWRLKP